MSSKKAVTALRRLRSPPVEGQRAVGLVIRMALWFLPRWGETKSEGDFTRFVPVVRVVVES